MSSRGNVERDALSSRDAPPEHRAPGKPDDLEARIEAAVKNPRNLGEMENADAVGTVGSPECGDMLRMWLKFKEEDGRKIIDRATFQSFGCQTAIAVASVATELLAGKTIAEAQAMSGEELAAPLGALPPVRIHCAQLVEGALRSALTDSKTAAAPQPATNTSAPTLFDQLSANTNAKVKVVLNKPATS
jgi:nitrogen fixation NifU-like protein